SGPNRGRVYLAWNESVDWYYEYYAGAITGNVTEHEAVNGTGVNDTPGTATAFTPGYKIRGWIGLAPTNVSAGDLDFYKFTATQGTNYVFTVDSMSVFLDMPLRIICSDGSTRLAYNEARQGFLDAISWTCPATGIYYLRP